MKQSEGGAFMMCPVHEWALRYVLLDTRLHVDALHHPLLYRWLQIPDLRLLDALPGLAEEGLRLDAGCAGLFALAEQENLAEDYSPKVEHLLTRRLRVRLANVSYPYLCNWLSTPMAYGARTVALVELMERGLQVRLGHALSKDATVEAPVHVPVQEPAQEPVPSALPEITDGAASLAEPAKNRASPTNGRPMDRAKLHAFANLN